MLETGRSAILHPAKDPGALADALQRAATSPSKEFAAFREAAYEAWQSKFSVESMVPGYLAAYEELKPGVWVVGGYCGHGNVLGSVYARAAVRSAITGKKEQLI